jgi:hypothetical protein
VSGPGVPANVSVERVVSALRRVRRGAYRVDGGAPGPTVTLTLSVSAAGRRNAAERIVAELADHGMRLDAADPVGTLAGGESLPVRSAG